MINSKKGFTLIELMIVVTVIGVLAGVTVTVINPQRQQEIAEDAVVQKRISDLALAIESYRTAEGVYPEQGTENNPLHESADINDVASAYIDKWPEGYIYNVSGDSFSIQATKPSSSEVFKYNSTWDEIRECGEETTETDVDSCEGWVADDIEPEKTKLDPAEPIPTDPKDGGTIDPVEPPTYEF